VERDLVALRNLLPRQEGGGAVLERLPRGDQPPRDPHVVARVELKREGLDPLGDHHRSKLGLSRREIKG
jgi:hypothetical protein